MMNIKVERLDFHIVIKVIPFVYRALYLKLIEKYLIR